MDGESVRRRGCINTASSNATKTRSIIFSTFLIRTLWTWLIYTSGKLSFGPDTPRSMCFNSSHQFAEILLPRMRAFTQSSMLDTTCPDVLLSHFSLHGASVQCTVFFHLSRAVRIGALENYRLCSRSHIPSVYRLEWPELCHRKLPNASSHAVLAAGCFRSRPVGLMRHAEYHVEWSRVSIV